MSLPRFFSRVADAIQPVAAVSRAELAEHLEDTTVSIHAPSSVTDSVADSDAALLAVNLAARLYPTLHISGPTAWIDCAATLAAAINPAADIDTAAEAPASANAVTLDWASNPARSARGSIVTVSAEAWNAHVDPLETRPQQPAAPLAALVAAALGVSEIFRVVFAEALGDRGRRSRQPGGFNLITNGEPSSVPLMPASTPQLPDAHLVGAGAVGQACLLALRAAGVHANLTVVDPQPVELSNLQRYVLTTDGDVGTAKTDLAVRAAHDTAVTVIPVPTRWGADRRSGPAAGGVVLTALDSAADRISVAASLPWRAYNAWTQPADVGWSRHEQFGTEPCLACLYYPDRPRLNEHELIATALRQHPLRILTYLITRTPVGAPLPHIATVPDLPFPPDASSWTSRPLLDDLAGLGFIASDDTTPWAGKPVGQLYRDGICAGGIVRLPGSADSEPAVVPLAHQSALAGIMLATTYVAGSHDSLQEHRAPQIEARFDLLRGFPQSLARPRARTSGCLCSDHFYRDAAHGPA
ncbi:MAG TPA: ThiF family adenylyltransferase [Streptosporangiaceae bacterium]|nr:ThiF family adenylyltransferase [Streptosporangiaceae bacterium]